MLQRAIAGRATIAMETAGGFAAGFGNGESGGGTQRGRGARTMAGGLQEELKLRRIQSAHDARERFFQGSDGKTDNGLMEAFSGGVAFAHGADELFDRFDGAAGGEDAWMFGLRSSGIDPDAHRGGHEPE